MIHSKRKIIYLFSLYLALFVFIAPAKSDVGDCVRYKARFVLSDGSEFEAYTQITSYDPMIQYNDSLFYQELLEFSQNRDSLELYKRIQTIEYPKTMGQYYNFKFSVVAEEDIFRIDFHNVLSVKLKEIEPCEVGNFREEGRESFGIHYYGWLITELNQNEIDLLQEEPFFTAKFDTPERIEYYIALSYNDSISESEVNEICSDLDIKFYRSLKSSDPEESKLNAYMRAKKELRNRGVVLIKFKSYY